MSLVVPSPRLSYGHLLLRFEIVTHQNCRIVPPSLFAVFALIK
jgi:hypothetical protein